MVLGSCGFGQSKFTLKQIHICLNHIGKDGAKAMAKALDTIVTLTWLNMADNDIGEDGANSIAKALETNITLQTLFM